MIAAFLTTICYKIASEYLLLFGRRRFVFMILIGGCWAFLWMHFLPVFFPDALEYRVIGWVIPGLIANNFERQGVVITTALLVSVTVFVYFAGRLLNSVI